jgi:undecaprenyl-diphosphatase
MFASAPWDQSLFAAINGARWVLLDWVMPLASSPVVLLGLAVAAVVWTLRQSGLRQAGIVALALAAVVGVSDLTCGVVKKIARRPRPLAVEHGVWAHGDAGWQHWEDPPGGGKSSFPSAHAANAMAATVVLLTVGGWRRRVLWLPGIVGYSRIYLGKHYPTDVLAGFAVGLAVGLVISVLVQSFRSRGAASPGG